MLHLGQLLLIELQLIVCKSLSISFTSLFQFTLLVRWVDIQTYFMLIVQMLKKMAIALLVGYSVSSSQVDEQEYKDDETLQRSQLQTHYKLYDNDQDGKLTQQELYTAIKQELKSEVKYFQQIKGLLDTLFPKYNTNGDGLDVDQFINLARQTSKILDSAPQSQQQL